MHSGGRRHSVFLMLGVLLFAALLLFRGYLTPVATPASILDTVEQPPGFTIQRYAGEVPVERSMTLSPAGTLYLRTRSEDKAYALIDSNRDYRVDKIYLLARACTCPMTWLFTTLAEVNRILRFTEIESRLAG